MPSSLPPTPKLHTITIPPHTERILRSLKDSVSYFGATTAKHSKHIKITYANHLQFYGLSYNKLANVMLCSRGV